MDTLIDELRALLDRYDRRPHEPAPPRVDPDTPPAGFVYVRPTGPQGAGKARLWPKPYRHEGQRPQDGEMLWAYADRCSKTTNPQTGVPCWPHGNWPDVPGFNPYLSVNGLAEMLDRDLYPFDWMPQEEIDRQEAMAERDRAEGNRFSGG